MIQLSRTILSESINFLKLQKRKQKGGKSCQTALSQIPSFFSFHGNQAQSYQLPVAGYLKNGEFTRRVKLRVMTGRNYALRNKCKGPILLMLNGENCCIKKECLICKNKNWKQFRKVKERKERRRGVLWLHFEKWKDIQCVVYKCDDRVIATILSPEIPLHAYHLPSFENHAMICIMLCAFLTRVIIYRSFRSTPFKLNRIFLIIIRDTEILSVQFSRFLKILFIYLLINLAYFEIYIHRHDCWNQNGLEI